MSAFAINANHKREPEQDYMVGSDAFFIVDNSYAFSQAIPIGCELLIFEKSSTSSDPTVYLGVLRKIEIGGPDPNNEDNIFSVRLLQKGKLKETIKGISFDRLPKNHYYPVELTAHQMNAARWELVGGKVK